MSFKSKEKVEWFLAGVGKEVKSGIQGMAL